MKTSNRKKKKIRQIKKKKKEKGREANHTVFFPLEI